MRVNPVLTELGHYPLARVQERARALRDEGKPLIDFSIGDPREPTPPFIREALQEAVPEVSQYPTAAGLPRLRGAIADYLGRRFGLDIDPDTQVIPTAGAKEGIFSLPLAFIDRADPGLVVYGSPAYPVYERGARFAGAAVHPVPLADDFVLRAAAIPMEVWEEAAIVWVCTPHNPTGSVTSRTELADLVDAARGHDVLLISDECYADLWENERPASVLEVAGPDFTNVLAFCSCSKRSGMTGYRSGAAVGDAEAIAALRRLRSSVGTASPEFVQEAAAAAWGDDGHAEERRLIFARKRRILQEAFAEMSVPVAGSEAGLYIWAGVGDDAAVTERLLDEGVVVAPGSGFGAGGEGYIRLALVPTPEECEESTEVLRKCLTGS